jgi:hypothetical protein
MKLGVCVCVCARARAIAACTFRFFLEVKEIKKRI